MRIYLAATGTGMSKQIKEDVVRRCRPKYVLETFFNGEKACEEALRIVGNDNFLLDSGAFSYMNGAKVTLEQLDKYIDRYINFIIANKIKYFFEIDVDNIFGLESVERWRRKIENAVGYQSIPVWHKGRGVEYWKQMCETYSYVAIGGLVFHVKKQEHDLIRRLVDYAYYKGVKVHGLGFTRTKELSKYKFYSVDSASWVISATRGQQIHFFADGKIRQRELVKSGRKTNLPKLAAHNMEEWVKFQKYMDGVMQI